MKLDDAYLIRGMFGAVTLVASMLLNGCASSPATHFVTLNSMPASAPLAVTPIQPVQLTAVHIPPEWDRPEVVREPAPYRLEISETERWGAPLADLMRLTLARDLAARLPDGTFYPPELPAPKESRSLVVTVVDIGVPVKGDLTLDASWTLVARGSDQVAFVQHAMLRVPITGLGDAAQAAALSRALAELADHMAQSLSAR